MNTLSPSWPIHSLTFFYKPSSWKMAQSGQKKNAFILYKATLTFNLKNKETQIFVRPVFQVSNLKKMQSKEYSLVTQFFLDSFEAITKHCRRQRCNQRGAWRGSASWHHQLLLLQQSCKNVPSCTIHSPYQTMYLTKFLSSLACFKQFISKNLLLTKGTLHWLLELNNVLRSIY